MSKTLGWRRTWVMAPVALAGVWAGGGDAVVRGECSEVFGSEVCAWSKTSGGTVVEFGAVIPLAAIERAPAHAEMKWPPVPTAVIPLPPEVRASTGFDHIQMGWEPSGHPPLTFEVPHFDFHFYTISPEQVRAIDCSDSSKPERLPNGYVLMDLMGTPVGDLIGFCVPGMGMHSLPQQELEREGQFEKTMVIGYYEGQLIFVEPMITKSLLMKRKGFSLPVPELVDEQARVRYPARFRAEYDGKVQAYRLVFSRLQANRPTT